jgi:Carboxypeptidase regulatory-like domain
MHLSPRRTWRAGLVSLVGIVAAFVSGGCGGGGVASTVSGKVLYKGAPVKGGNVTFVSTEGKISKSTSINEDGTYQLTDVPVGTFKICVETESFRPQVARTMSKGPGTGGMPPAYSAPPGGSEQTGYKPPVPVDTSARYVQIPPQYAKTETTDLTYTVKSGQQTHDIELK